MIKYIIILMNMLVLMIIRMFFIDDVSVKLQMPSQVNSGEEFTVSLTINKGSITGVGHLKQELPEGFSVTLIEDKGAEFKYLPKDNVVKFTWISLPAESEFTISYKLKVDTSVFLGMQSLGGKFSYVVDNKKQTFEIPISQIMVSAGTPPTATTQPEPPPTTRAEPSTATQPKPAEPVKTTADVFGMRTIIGSPEAGKDFTVDLNITKNGIKGFARVQEILPAGLTAIAINSSGGTFSFIGQKMKIIWDVLPPNEEIKVSYRVVCGNNASGNMDITGFFSYVEKNDPKKIEIAATTISVIPNYLLADKPIDKKTDTTTQPKTTTATTTQPEPTTATTTTQPEPTATTKTTADVFGTRTIVGNPEAGMEFTVELNITKNNIKGFARVQEILPAGLTAIALNSGGGTFSFLEQKIKIIWDNLPADENIKVLYRVACGDNTSGNMTITGAFSYVENDAPKKTEIAATTISVMPKTTIAATTAETTSTTASTTEPVSTTEPTTTAGTTEPTTTGATSTTIIPSTEKNISFKVQICALSKVQRSASYFESKYSIGEKVIMEYHEGWKKYIVGKYSQYKDARDHREDVRTKGIENPFVTAYNNGKRITVQEGLMISQQRWLR
ncbi:MAG: hypothetical protein V1781_00715 [Bacteroidota bacterium]